MLLQAEEGIKDRKAIAVYHWGSGKTMKRDPLRDADLQGLLKAEDEKN